MRRPCGLCYIRNESSRPNMFIRFVETNGNATRWRGGGRGSGMIRGVTDSSASEGNYPLVIVQLKLLYPINRGNRDGSNDIICLAPRLNLAGIYVYLTTYQSRCLNRSRRTECYSARRQHAGTSGFTLRNRRRQFYFLLYHAVHIIIAV